MQDFLCETYYNQEIILTNETIFGAKINYDCERIRQYHILYLSTTTVHYYWWTFKNRINRLDLDIFCYLFYLH